MVLWALYSLSGSVFVSFTVLSGSAETRGRQGKELTTKTTSSGEKMENIVNTFSSFRGQHFHQVCLLRFLGHKKSNIRWKVKLGWFAKSSTNHFSQKGIFFWWSPVITNTFSAKTILGLTCCIIPIKNIAGNKKYLPTLRLRLRIVFTICNKASNTCKLC